MWSIRVAGPADAPALARLINAAYRVEDFFIDGDRTDALDLHARIGTPDTTFLVIDDGATGQPIASVYVHVSGRHGHFGLLAVDPGRQGEGLGRALVAGVEAHCRRAGCTELSLDFVNLREELPGFYAALGFVETGATAPMPEGEKLKRPAHLVRMEKPLDAPPRG